MALQRLPGLIDIHVHLREPGQTHKEDFYTGSRAALAGGFTFICDMPNNSEPTLTMARLNKKISLAKKALCDIGFYIGTNGKNTKEFKAAARSPKCFGLKVYCNHTTGELLVDDLALLENIFAEWKSEKPILVHAEGVQLAAIIALAYAYSRRLHVCHVSQAIEVELVARAKARGLSITAGATPHHLFLTNAVRKKLGGYACMKPPLGTQTDQDALWKGIADGTIDIVETDHAPHTREEKEKDPPAYGVPGLETAVGLLYKAVKDKKLKKKDVEKLLYTNPKKIFAIPEQKDTYIELDPDAPWVAGEGGYAGKCDWSPFDGWTLYGKPQTVVLRGKKIVEKGRVLS